MSLRGSRVVWDLPPSERGIMEGKARFNQNVYKQCDPTTKDILVRYLNKKGIYAIAEEKRDADVKALVLTYWEGEIKLVWPVGSKWPKDWKTVDIPGRKAALLKKHGAENLTFMVISGDLTHAWIVPGVELTKKRFQTKPYTSRSKNEKFFMIPVELCKLISLEGII